ncbi:MAG: hypothetical protein RL338_877 [Chloroflexota bacterium]
MSDPVAAGLVAVAVGFLAGSIPFSLVVGRLVAGVDPRSVGDGNPGAANVSRAGGRGAGALAAFLDISKGIVPVSIAVERLELTGPLLALAIVAPVAGHVRTPWLRGRGGKGTATAFGVLIPVTLPLGPLLMPLLLVALYKLVRPDGWAPVLSLAVVTGTLAVAGAAPEIVAATAGIGAIVASRYAADLRQGIHLRRAGRAG